MYCILFYSIIFYYIFLNHIILYCILFYYILFYYIILYYIILYYIISYYIILYYTILCYIILYYTKLFYILYTIITPAVYTQGLVAQFRVDNRCFLGKMHDRHLKGSRYMLRREFPRHHFLKVRSTWWRLPVCSCACTISTLLFSCKMILFAMAEVLQVPQLEDSRLTSEATDG